MNMPQSSALAPSQSWRARRHFRQCSRQLLQQPDGAAVHIARLQASFEVPGTEPVQGTLADAFYCLSAQLPQLLASEAYGDALARLPRNVANAFTQLGAATGAQGEQQRPHLGLLATRWSVCLSASAQLPTRARRASSDEARRMAQDLVQALQQGGEGAQELEASFLAHCAACHDKLAFMLARREVLKLGLFTHLPPAWQEVADKLEN